MAIPTELIGGTAVIRPGFGLGGAIRIVCLVACLELSPRCLKLGAEEGRGAVIKGLGIALGGSVLRDGNGEDIGLGPGDRAILWASE